MRPSAWKILLLFPLFILLSNCEAQPQRELFNVLAGKDHQGPVLLGWHATGTHSARCSFDEFVRCDAGKIVCPDGTNAVLSAVAFEREVELTFSRPLVPGKRQEIRARVTDMVGNSLSFTVGIWGYNANPPELRINEFVTKGSSTNPDRVELYVKQGGNLAGITLYDGMSGSFDSECILPAFAVSAGDHVVIEYGERLRGIHPIEFWGGEVGLGANNGVISLYDAPEGRIIDAVLYSNRTSSSDEQYGGFGTKKVQQRAVLLQESGEWKPIPIVPESGVDSTYCTATRSICRTPGAADTDRAADWHVVPTGKASFGNENEKESYHP
ncbi:MAG: hypothetical protein WCY74_03810 [Sphaerochaetaceae bacterium]